MKLSTRARYSLRLMLDIALHSMEGAPVQLKDISERQGISNRYLGQIVMALKHAQLIRGISGKNGGYLLTKPPKEITVEDIINASIGPVNVVECAMNPAACEKSDLCEIRDVYSLVNKRIAQTLREFTIEDLLELRTQKTMGMSEESNCTNCASRDLCSSDFK